jgi:polysaccharide biosynthesis protein PslH
MRILMIADYLPYPLVSGDRIRIYNLLSRVSRRHEVSLVAFLMAPEDAEGVPHLQQLCAKVEIATFQQRSRLAKTPGMLRYALEGKPPELSLAYSEELAKKIRRLVVATKFDIVQIESRMALYIEMLQQDEYCKKIMMFQNFTFQQDSRVFLIEKQWGRKIRVLLNSLAMRHWEPRYAERFDRCITVSQLDKNLLMNINPRLHVDVIPNGVDIQKYQPLAIKNVLPSLLFIGNMGYPPCVDAAIYFCKEIFPLILRRNDAVNLWIVGRNPRPEVLNLKSYNVHVTGRVVDVIPYYQLSAVSVVPLRAGGGTRLKILESMALGRPVVSTTIGCEGLDVVDGKHLLIADDPRLFAEKTVRLLGNPQLYKELAINGRQLVEALYDWDKIADDLMEIYRELLS